MARSLSPRGGGKGTSQADPETGCFELLLNTSLNQALTVRGFENPCRLL